MDAETSLVDRLLATPPNPQTDSPLFSTLPAEVRTAIFKLALADYPNPDPSKHYGSDAIFSRPAYSSPRRTDTALLRTCRAAYIETWFLPFILREQIHYVGRPDREPPEYSNSHGLNLQTLTGIMQKYKVGGEGDETVEIDAVRVFTQMWKLEDADEIAELVRTPGLRFRRLTITIRHTDWWHWERDMALSIDGGKGFLRKVSAVLPDTVREIRMELESLERKKGQVDELAAMMRERWFFRRVDGEGLFADISENEEENAEKKDGQAEEEGLVSRWSGSSTWQHQRWVRDETEEGKIDYYVRTVPFRPRHIVEAKGGRVSEELITAADAGDFDAERLKLRVQARPMVYRGPAYEQTDRPAPRQNWGHRVRNMPLRDLRLNRPPHHQQQQQPQ